MSPDPDPRIERIRAALTAIEAGNLEEVGEILRDFVHEDLEWSALIATVQGRSYQGRAGMMAFFEDLTGSFQVKYENVEIRVFGDEVLLLLTTMQLRGRESGVGMDQQLGVLFEYEDGLVRRGNAHESHDEAIRAAEALVNA